MSNKGNPPSANQPPKSPAGSDQGSQGKKKARIRKPGKWVEVDVDGEIIKGRFKYVKFTDSDDGLETYWIAPE